MIQEVLTYPDKTLLVRSNEVIDFDESLHVLLDDMYDTMRAYEGIGLAAIQIGVQKRVLVINLVDEESGEQNKSDLKEFVNPIFLEKDGSTTYKEGCLSVPEFYEEVERAKSVKVRYQNRNGEFIEEEFDGLMAIAMQHEMDHLDGHLFIEHISYLKRKKFDKEFKRKKKERASF